MIHNQPKQEIFYDDTRAHSFDIRIRSMFKEFRSTFVILNPFVKGDTLVSWNSIMSMSEHFKNLNIISRNSGFYNFTLYEADVDEWGNFESFIRSNKIIPPNPEMLQKKLFNDILKELKTLGYASLKKEYVGEESIIDIDGLISLDETLVADTKITTLDNKFCLAQDFDQITTFFNGTKDEINEIANKIGLEGFFADDALTLLWDRVYINENKKIERDKINLDLD